MCVCVCILWWVWESPPWPHSLDPTRILGFCGARPGKHVGAAVLPPLLQLPGYLQLRFPVLLLQEGSGCPHSTPQSWARPQVPVLLALESHLCSWHPFLSPEKPFRTSVSLTVAPSCFIQPKFASATKKNSWVGRHHSTRYKWDTSLLLGRRRLIYSWDTWGYMCTGLPLSSFTFEALLACWREVLVMS